MKKSLRRSFISSVAAVVLIISLFTFGAAAKSESAYSLTVENTCAPSFTAQDSSAGALSFFGDREFDGCYGNQLSGVARELYDSLVKSYATDKTTGEYTYAFDTPFTFTAEISEGSIVMNDELEEIQLELHYAVQAAADAFLYDYPEVFWLKIIRTSYSISASGNFVDGYTGIIDDITITPTEIYDGASDYISEYSSAVSSALGFISVTESRYETLKNIHDYICNNAWYNLVSEQRVHSSEPFFIGDGGVVCEGYAKAFKVLCDRLELPCVLVSGDAGGAHMWNYVQMEDGKWYLVDATWDDQTSGIYYTYFIADATTVGFNDVAISEERTESSDFSGTGIFSFAYPELSSAVYIPHIHEWESDYTVDIEPTCTEKGSKSIHCRTCEATKSVTEVDATNHANKTEHAQQDATCTENGYTAGVYCNDCGKWVGGHNVITAEGHTDENVDGLCDVCENIMPNVIQTGSCGKNLKYVFYSEGTLIINGTGTMLDYKTVDSPFCNMNITNIIIQEGVTKIGVCAFKGLNKITDIVIPDSVHTIGAEAFRNCGKLNNVVIGKNVTHIGYMAFDDGYMNNKEKYKINNLYISTIEDWFEINVDYNLEMEDYGLLSNVKNLYFNEQLVTELEIPENVTTITPYMFEGYDGLKTIKFSNNVETIGFHAFSDCDNIESITIPASIKNIGGYAFGGCNNLKTINFELDKNNKSQITSMPSVRLSEVKEIVLPASINSIGSYVFSNKLEKITIYNPECSFNSSCGLNYNHTIIGFKGSTAEKFAEEIGAEFIDVETVHKHIYKRVEVSDSTCSKAGEIVERCTCGKEAIIKTDKLAHNEVKISGKAATCTKTGLTEGKKCTGCGEVTVAQKTVAKKSHTYKTTTTKATLKKNGKQVTKCTVCGEVKSSKTIYYPKSIKLSATTYTYNGKTKTPSVVVKDSKGNTLKKDTDYTVKYASGRKNPGKYTVTVTFKGKYEGTKKLIFTIKPAKVTLSKLTAGSKQLTATWKTVAAVTGYEVMYSTSSKFTSKTTKKTTVKSAKTKKLTIKKLNKGKKYYIKVRAYKTVDGKKIYGSWSSVKSIKVK